MSTKRRTGQKLAFIPLFILTGCIDFHGAQDPYAYAPRTAHTVWKPCAEPSRIPDNLPEEFDFLEEVEPLSLGEALDIALINNPTTKSNWASARVAAAEYGQSLQNDFILSNISGQYQRYRSAFYIFAQKNIFYQSITGGALNLSYLLLDFGQTRYSSYAALESLYNADWEYNRSIQTVIQQVMSDYYNYLFEKEKLVAAKADVENATITLDAVMSKLRNGLADISDKVQATTQLMQSELALVQQKQSLHNAYTQLINDLGVPPNLNIKFLGYPEKIEPFDVETLDQLILVAMQNRPDLIAAEANYKSQENALIAAQRKRWPTVTTDFTLGRNYFGQGETDHYNFNFVASLSYPLFQGFYIENSIKLAKANLESAQASLDQTRLSVLQDVTNFREDVILAKEALSYAGKFLAAAKEEFRVLLEKYKVGTTTIVDVINAQTSVADAQSKYAQTQRDWFTSLVNLAFGTGALTLSDSQQQNLFEAKKEIPDETTN